ncbi:hypothetical protein D9M68_958080 [compost metagenome]
MLPSDSKSSGSLAEREVGGFLFVNACEVDLVLLSESGVDVVCYMASSKERRLASIHKRSSDLIDTKRLQGSGR